MFRENIKKEAQKFCLPTYPITIPEAELLISERY
jgi:hypothetical protein